MRDIKFRGQTGTTEGKKWVYGNYYKVKSFFNGEEAHFIEIIRNNHLTDFSIDKDTLGQYTGLKDKNGKEIYEKDIIQYEDIRKGVVEYSEKYAQFTLKETGSIADEHEALREFNIKVFEVIGNIYDNPELLEK